MMDLILIAIIVVCIVDVSGFTDSWKSMLKRIVTKGKMSSPDYELKPFTCSLCMTWWVGLIYLIVCHKFSLYMICLLLLISVNTPVIKDLIFTIRDLMIKVIDKIKL